MFTLNNALFDTSIAAWDAKRCWDSERPVTAIAKLAGMFLLHVDDWQSEDNVTVDSETVKF